jgi:transcriptional regulator with XRE-family HTH domain
MERRRLGWTQQVMAEIGGVSKSSQVGYEAGARVPDMRYLLNVAKDGADAVYLLFGERKQWPDAPSFNWNAHDQLLEVIETWLEEKRLRLPFRKKMQLLKLLVAHFELTNRIDHEYVYEQLRKAA